LLEKKKLPLYLIGLFCLIFCNCFICLVIFLFYDDFEYCWIIFLISVYSVDFCSISGWRIILHSFLIVFVNLKSEYILNIETNILLIFCTGFVNTQYENKNS